MENLTAQPIPEKKTESIPQTRRWKIPQKFLKYLSPVTGLLFLGQTVSMPAPVWADAQTSTAYLVDVIIHRSLPAQETEEWARDMVGNYLNRSFIESGINKRFVIDRIFPDYDETTGCSIPGTFEKYDRCESNDGRIRVWLYQSGIRSKGILTGTGANPMSAAIQQELSLPVQVREADHLGQKFDGNTMVHEIGHLFGLPDYYDEDVPASHNGVAPVGISPFARDVMHHMLDYHFSDISKSYIDRVDQLPIGFGEPHWSDQFTPKQTALEITDDEGMPFKNVQIEIFRQKLTVNSYGQIERFISNTLHRIGYTDDAGQFNLGNYNDLFRGIKKYEGDVAFLRITNNDEIRYAAITKSYLNHLFFRGYENEALISVPFSSLLRLEKDKIPSLSAPGIAIN